MEDAGRVLTSSAVSRILYFAYGSNMDTATLRDRRGIEWSRSVVALARGWRLAVDKPSLLGSGEAMATIVTDPAAEVWGVLYEISASDYEHLELTEGVLIDHYQRTELVVEPAGYWDGADHGRIVALTLASDSRDPSIRPTTRYMRLLLDGAAEHALPRHWIDELARIEAVEQSDEVTALRSFFDHAMRKPD